MYKNKTYVCKSCRKIIAYSAEQAGQTQACPYCQATITFPVNPGSVSLYGPQKPRHSKSLWAFGAMFVFVTFAAMGGILLLQWRGFDMKKLTAFSLFDLVPFPASVAPRPAHVRGSRATLAVTDVRYGYPEIFQTDQNKTAKTETPVCVVSIRITNAGKAAVHYRSWRIFDCGGTAKNAVLTGKNGAYNLVSFGVGCRPAGTRSEAELAPGQSLNDQILFLCNAKPAGELKLTLPAEHVGGKGDIRITIPPALIH